MNLKSGLPPRWAILSTEPVTKLSMAMTLWPRARRRSHKWEPRKPAPPVMTEVGCFFIELFLDLRGIVVNSYRTAAGMVFARKTKAKLIVPRNREGRWG